MNLPEGIAFGSLVLAMGAFVFRISNKQEDKAKRVYDRIDDVKEGVKKDYVMNTVCSETQKRVFDKIAEVKEDTKEMKADLKQLLRKNGVI